MWSSLLAATLSLPFIGPGMYNGSREFEPAKDGKFWIYSENISAAFIPYGASLTNLIIRDQYGVARDIVAGFDNASYYSIDQQHPHLNGIPGRYANRIRNSSFIIDGEVYNVLPNENPTPDHPNGINTLHGGPNGWDWRNFTVFQHTKDSISFTLVDPSGSEGFPGRVVSFITYALTGNIWDIKMVAIPTQGKTPIMLSSHTYWNLDGFSNNETGQALNHSLHLPYSYSRVGVDSILVPTGELLANNANSANDFWSAPKQLAKGFSKPGIEGNCGLGCVGYDNCFLINRTQEQRRNWRRDGYVARVHSSWSGIQLDVYTDQEAIQLYSCNGQNGSLAIKRTQGLRDEPAFPRTIPKYGCLVLEVQDWIDGINHPAWQREKQQIFAVGEQPYVLQASYEFSVNTTTA